jgi:hypothetical protein
MAIVLEILFNAILAALPDRYIWRLLIGMIVILALLALGSLMSGPLDSPSPPR